jgi:serpin B
MRVPVVFLAVALIAVACGTAPATPPTSPRSSAASTPSPTASVAPATPAVTSEPAIGIGSAVVTVSDRLRVRSAPGVSDDSIKYEPLLPLGTELLVVGGPVEATGYTWWQVEPMSFALQEATVGWVAMADHDGEPWIALSGDASPQLAMAVSDVARMPVGMGQAQAAANSITSFGLDLYRRLLEDPDLGSGNVVFSPTSIALALGMARAGARGETATEIDDVLRASNLDELLGGLNALDQALESRDATWQDSDGKRQLALRIANASFGQNGWSIEQAFLDALAATFGSGLHLVDYQSDPEGARRAINGWVGQRTAGRIPELLAPPDVTEATRLYLVNAMYLKAEWERWFEEDRTEKASFARLDGSKVDVDMMARSSGAHDPVIPYARGSGWQAVDLRYKAPPGSPPLAMTLVLPKDLPGFESKVDGAPLSEIVTKLDGERAAFIEPECPPEFDTGCYPYDLRLYVPRFSIDTRAPLQKLLAAAGIEQAFDPESADFTGIHVPAFDGEQLYISAVIHQANIDVDEHGTEAAAATAVGMDTGGGPSALDNITIRFDRPFLFFVRDVETGTILFMGRVVDPSDTP